MFCVNSQEFGSDRRVPPFKVSTESTNSGPTSLAENVIQGVTVSGNKVRGDNRLARGDEQSERSPAQRIGGDQVTEIRSAVAGESSVGSSTSAFNVPNAVAGLEAQPSLNAWMIPARSRRALVCGRGRHPGRPSGSRRARCRRHPPQPRR